MKLILEFNEQELSADKLGKLVALFGGESGTKPAKTKRETPAPEPEPEAEDDGLPSFEAEDDGLPNFDTEEEPPAKKKATKAAKPSLDADFLREHIRGIVTTKEKKAKLDKINAAFKIKNVSGLKEEHYEKYYEALNKIK